MTDVTTETIVEKIDDLVAERASCNAAIEGAKEACDRAIDEAREECAPYVDACERAIEEAREAYAARIEDASRRKNDIELALSAIYERLGLVREEVSAKKTRKPRDPSTYHRGPRKQRADNGEDVNESFSPNVGEFQSTQHYSADPQDAAE
jgi:prefoldin subunit 5